MVDKLKELPEVVREEKFLAFGYSLPIYKSDLFPFEIMYDACNVETKSEFKIPSGEWIHGVVIPQDYPESYKPTFDSFYKSEGIEFKNWCLYKGVEIYP